MLTTEEIIRKLREVLPFLKKEFRITKIGLFGSFAGGKATKESDIDIVIEFEKPIGLAFIDLAEYLENLFNKKVDILTPEGIRSIRVNKIAQEINRSIIYV
ncbi:MAG: nucleotidyltransferase family protein [Promethearchaeota archaeon]